MSPGSPSGAVVWLGQRLFPCYATWQDSVWDQCFQLHRSGSRGPAPVPCPATQHCPPAHECAMGWGQSICTRHTQNWRNPPNSPRSPAATAGVTQKHRCGQIGLLLPYHSALSLEVIMATSPREALGVFNSHIWVESSLSYSERLTPVHKQWVTPYSQL